MANERPSAIRAKIGKKADAFMAANPLPDGLEAEELETAVAARGRACREACDPLFSKLAEVIDRVGVKIAKLREHALPDREPEFVAFRNGLYEIPEDDREKAVDDLMAEWGIDG